MPAREHSRRPSTPMEKRDPRDSFEDPHPRSTTAKPPPRDYRSSSSYLSPEPASSVSPIFASNKAIMDALQDVVTIKQVPSSNMNYGSLTRTRPTRSATTGPSPSATRPRHVPSRSMSSDSFERPFKKESANLSASTPPATDRPAKPVRKKSHHVDLIDQLDYSSLGQGTFHHDGPFDALAPSRNRNNIAKAPMRAFNEEEAILAAAAPPDLASSLTHVRKNSDSPYALASMAYSGQPSPTIPLDSYYTRPATKNTLAEAWGRADPEPFEEFSAGGYIGPGSNGAPISNRIMNGDDAASRAKDLELAARNARRNARIAPPPQPIFLPGSEFAPTRSYDGPTSPNENPFTPDGRPKRNKSLINRFRRVRDNPNIPPNPPYPPPGVANGYRYDDSPTEDKFSPSPDSFVIVDADRQTPGNVDLYQSSSSRDAERGRSLDIRIQRRAGTADYRPGRQTPMYVSTREKELPPPPEDYFNQNGSGGSTEEDDGHSTSPGPMSVGTPNRKASLMRRMKGLGAKVTSR